MSFIQREHDKLHELCCSLPVDSDLYQRAYMAKQALAWAMDPDGFASPTALLVKWDGAKVDGTSGTGIATAGNLSPAPSPGPGPMVQ